MKHRFVAVLAAASAPALAQPPPVASEIVVFGDVRAAEIDSLPGSVSVIERAAIERRNAQHLEEILGLAANVNVASGASRSRFVQIRGIGERGQFAEPLNPSVGLLVDGVDISATATAAALFDVDQVEVFRGPQGTRYGANALAGLINIKTRAPSDTFEAEAGIEAANYAAATAQGVVSGPLGATVAGRFAAQYHRSDGFLSNSFLGSDRGNARDELSWRSKLSWDAADTIRIDALLGQVDIDNGYDAFSLDNDRTTRSDEPGRDAQRTALAGLATALTGAERFTIEASLNMASSDSTYGYDEDWTYVGFHPAGYSSTDYYLRKHDTLTGEARVLSTDQGRAFDGTTDWAFGAYVLDSDADLTRVYTFLPAPFESTFAVQRHALFGQLDASLGATTLTFGLRLERHRSQYRDSEDVAFTPSDDLVGWRIGADLALAGQVMGYAVLSGGYKAGGFNTDGTLDADLRQYEPETLTSLELGVKGRLAGGRLTTRLAVFAMRRDDVQIASSLTRVRDDGSAEFIDFIGNAAKGTNRGLEAELALTASERLELTASVGLLDSEYSEFINAAGENLDGREQAHAPSYQYSITARYVLTDRWQLDATIEGRDGFFFSDSHDTRSEPYALLGAGLTYDRDLWRVRLWVRNLLDEDTFVRGYYFGNDPRIDYAERAYTQLGEPRRGGVTATRRF